MLPGPFGHDDHCMLAGEQPPFAAWRENHARLKFERHLGDEAEVGLAARDDGRRCDEAGFASHQLHQADAVEDRFGFDVGAVDRDLRLSHRGGEAERHEAIFNVVVDRLGNADDGDRQLPPRASPAMACAPACVPSPPMQNSMLMPRFVRKSTVSLRILRSTRGAENRAAEVVDVVDQSRASAASAAGHRAG